MKKIKHLLLALLTLCSANVFAEDYGLYVGSIRVSDENANNILNNRTAKFDPATMKLTLSNATIETSGSAYGIDVQEDITIELIGENTITAAGTALHLFGNTTITGAGSLILNGTGTPICLDRRNLTIENTSISISGSTATKAIYGTSTSHSEQLIVDKSYLNIDDYFSDGTITGIGALTLIDCNMYRPSLGKFDTEQHAVVNGSSNVLYTEEIQIEPMRLGINVAGTQVNVRNASDVLGNGKVRYNPETNTLTLDKATLSATSLDNGIESQIANLTIDLVGENTINSASASGILFKADAKITGSGSLTTSGSNGIYLYGGNLTIENTTITATGTRKGIGGFDSTDTLTITNSIVRATGTGDGSIKGLKKLI